MTTKQQRLLDEVATALEAYHATEARALPSVKKSVPRAFLDAVDALTDALDKVIANA